MFCCEQSVSSVSSVCQMFRCFYIIYLYTLWTRKPFEFYILRQKKNYIRRSYKKKLVDNNVNLQTIKSLQNLFSVDKITHSSFRKSAYCVSDWLTIPESLFKIQWNAGNFFSEIKRCNVYREYLKLPHAIVKPILVCKECIDLLWKNFRLHSWLIHVFATFFICQQP